MKRIVVFVFILMFIFSIPAAASEPTNPIKLEWEISQKLIESYQNGTPKLHLKTDLSKINAHRIYGYVYAVIPERLNIKTNIKNQEIWIETLENQNHENSIKIAKEVKESIIKENMSDLEKITAIHDWIVCNTKFASDETTATKITNENIWAYSADGVFTQGRAVCSGYAAAFKMLCDVAEIPCFTINSKIKNHTWNAVYYDGAWRFIDASSETRATRDIDIASIYRYFMLNENELPLETHEFDPSTQQSLNAKEYIDFFNYYENKEHNFQAKSAHLSTMELLAEKQNRYAMFELGACYQNGWFQLQKNNQKCFEWQYKSALLDHVVSQNNIGYFYKNGIGTQQDYEKAFYWYKKAADKGYIYSQIQLGHFYENGLYVAKDSKQAKLWYQKAADQGDKTAIEILTKLP